MTKDEKRLKAVNSELREEMKYLKEDLNSFRIENFKLKRWIESKFKWWAKLISNDDSPCLKWLIKDTGKILKYWD